MGAKAGTSTQYNNRPLSSSKTYRAISIPTPTSRIHVSFHTLAKSSHHCHYAMSQPERRPSVAEVKAHFEAMQKATNQQSKDQSPPPPTEAHDEPSTTTISPLSAKTKRKFTAIANALRERNLAALPTPPADHPTGYENATSFQGRFDHQSRKDRCPAFWPPERGR